METSIFLLLPAAAELGAQNVKHQDQPTTWQN
jgi:hypothetical protein